MSRERQSLHQFSNKDLVESSQARLPFGHRKKSSFHVAHAASQRNIDNLNIGSAAELIGCEVWDQKGKFIGVIESVSLLLRPCNLFVDVYFAT